MIRTNAEAFWGMNDDRTLQLPGKLSFLENMRKCIPLMCTDNSLKNLSSSPNRAQMCVGLQLHDKQFNWRPRVLRDSLLHIVVEKSSGRCYFL